MITKYRFGNVFETGAVTAAVREGEKLPCFDVRREGAGTRFCCPLGKDDVVFGLGETMRGIDKRGGRYVSFNTDNPHHNDEMPSLYGSHNFLIVDGEQTFGAFFDTPARVIFDIDYEGSGKIEILAEQGVAVYFVRPYGRSASGRAAGDTRRRRTSAASPTATKERGCRSSISASTSTTWTVTSTSRSINSAFPT